MASASARSTQAKHIWTVTGPAGCGKSTVAQSLSKQLGLPYIEGDEFHPPANITKMASGQPLTDADRWDWLVLLRKEAVRRLHEAPQPQAKTAVSSSSSSSLPAPSGVVLTCSALKQKYRDVLRVASCHHPHVRIHFIYLKADEEVLLARVKARQGHYMKDDMVRSQFRSLEEPEEEERLLDCEIVDVGADSVEVQELALKVVKERLKHSIAEATPA